MNPFWAKIKTNYNAVPYGDHGAERVNAQLATYPALVPKAAKLRKSPMSMLSHG